MASVLDSIKRFYSGDDAIFNNLLVFIASMVIGTLMAPGLFEQMQAGIKNPTIPPSSYSIGVIWSFYFIGYFLLIMNNRINGQEVGLPVINLKPIQIAVKAIPFGIIYFLIAFVIGLIPIIGGLIAIFIVTPMQVKYAKNFDLKYATEWMSTKELIVPMIVPTILLSLKMMVLITLTMIPVIWVCFMFLKNQILMLSLVFYFITIISIVYNDNLAQIFTEVNYEPTTY